MENQTYDYIVVGAGSAGSVLANRLTASGKYRVLLLEAGRASHPWSRIPIGFAKLLDNPAANWRYSSEPEENTHNRRIPVPRGKLLGGSSAINGMVFVRGQAQDFDTWGQLGNRGWSYREVLPIFREMECYSGGDDEFRGREGPLRVSDTTEGGPLYDVLIKAAEQAGIPYNADYNGTIQEGISMTQATINKGRRMSTAYCYLDPAKDRPNLQIVTEALTEKLLFDGKRCIGVRYTVNGRPQEAKAGREVVVSTGSINSPQLLELSGVGQAERLRGLGIDVVHDLPGVGENLRDHYAVRLKYDIGAHGMTYNDRARGLGLVWQALHYAIARKGLLNMPASPVRAYVKTREGLEAPDGSIAFLPFLATPDRRIDKRSGITLTSNPLRADSMGSIHVKSAQPTEPPAIRFNFLSAQTDRDVTLGVIRIARRIMEAPALDGVVSGEFAPGKHVQSDDELMAWARETGETTYHPIGTCKMGNDPRAVVDDQLRVHGLQGLRVADASIMPTPTSGNTNAPSIMIGEKAAKLVLADAA